MRLFLPALALPLVSAISAVFEETDKAVALATPDYDTVLLIDSDNEWPGVIRASKDLLKDIAAVTNSSDYLSFQNISSHSRDADLDDISADTAIVIGTIGHSSLVDQLIKDDLLSVSDLTGKWESYTIQYINNNSYIEGADNVIVIAGSDKRGSIYGIYSLSEQIGVSPWYWWADVPIAHHDEIWLDVTNDTFSKEPSVKYRGIFLNDEEPSLTGWANQRYPQGNYTHFVHEFYQDVFELILRLKANIIWPTMWRAMFWLDDEQNAFWADYYGVVMSTSHTEPLQRASNEWLIDGDGDWDYTTNNKTILNFWKEGIKRSKQYEGVWVEGMRGLGDRPMSDDVESQLLEEIIDAQRELLIEEFGNETRIEDIPQVWCLYKEVQSYYQQGMEVPDDIILLWVDDNWGNIRRLPQGNETERKGGAGVYYHFDYVGDPRNYKWINTISLEKTWEQMHMAYQRAAREFWIVNVGDLKPLEIPISYFIDLAYDFDTWGEPGKVPEWTQQWAHKIFGAAAGDNDTLVSEIGDIVDLYGFLAARRKYEYVAADTFSVVSYNEANRVLKEWEDIKDRAQAVFDTLPEEFQASFFEMVLHPCLAGWIVYDMQISAGKNAMYALQVRDQTNAVADRVTERFQDDYFLQKRWDKLLDGKWVHMMDQVHLGYIYWQNPIRNSMPGVQFINLQEESRAGSACLAVDGGLGSAPGDSMYNDEGYDNNTINLPLLDPFSANGTGWIEVYARGREDFEFELTPWNDYVAVVPSQGSLNASNKSLENSVLVQVEVDWTKAPDHWSLEYINFTTNVSYGWYAVDTVLFLPINKTQIPSNSSFNRGFVETGQYISIEADHFTGNSSHNGTYYTTINRYGRSKAGVTLFPVTAESQKATKDASYLEYDFYSFTSNNETNVTLTLSPSLNTNPYRPLKFAIGVDDDEPQVIQIYEDPTDPTAYPDGWEEAVEQSAWLRNTTHDLGIPGQHTLKLWALEPGVVFQKILIDLGGAQKSFLGPPETYFLEK